MKLLLLPPSANVRDQAPPWQLCCHYFFRQSPSMLDIRSSVLPFASSPDIWYRCWAQEFWGFHAKVTQETVTLGIFKFLCTDVLLLFSISTIFSSLQSSNSLSIIYLMLKKEYVLYAHFGRQKKWYCVNQNKTLQKIQVFSNAFRLNSNDYKFPKIWLFLYQFTVKVIDSCHNLSRFLLKRINWKLKETNHLESNLFLEMFLNHEGHIE